MTDPGGTQQQGQGEQGEGRSGVAEWASQHLWQIQPVRDVLLIAALLWLIYLGYLASIVTVPLLLAMLLAYLFEPVISLMRRRARVTRQRAVVAIIAALALFVFTPAAIGVGFGIAQGVSFADSLSNNARLVRRSVENPENETYLRAVPEGAWRSLRDLIVESGVAGTTDEPGLTPEGLEGSEPNAEPEIPAGPGAETEAGTAVADAGDESGAVPIARLAVSWIEQNASSIARGVFRTGAGAISVMVSIMGALATIAFGVFLTTFFFYFVATGWPKLVKLARDVLPEASRERSEELLKQMDGVVSGFVRGRLAISAILAPVFMLGYGLVGVPAAIVLGLVTALLVLIPYASMLSVPVAILLLYLEGHTDIRGEVWWVLVMPMAVYGLAQLIDEYLLTPLIMGEATDLDIPSVLFASLAGGALMGFYGLLLAIPLAACLKILIREVLWPGVRAWAKGERRDFLPLS
ncbi:MAG: AI-2E family transporter [Planctomycetota bacterium]